jgi:hypothetical protein
MTTREIRVTQLALAGFGLTLAAFGLVVGALTFGVVAWLRRSDDAPLAGELDAQLACSLCGDICCVQASA